MSNFIRLSPARAVSYHKIPIFPDFPRFLLISAHRLGALARAFRPPRRLPGPKRRWQCCRWTPLAFQRAIGVPMSPRERTPLTKTNIPDRDPANLKSSLFWKMSLFCLGNIKHFHENITFSYKAKYKENPAAASPARPSPAQQELGSRGSRRPRGSRARIRRAERS